MLPILLIFLYAPATLAQTDSLDAERNLPRNTLYVEAGGVGVVGSLNYERLIADRFNIRLGYTAFSFNFFEQVESEGWIIGGSYLIPVSTWAAERGGAYELGLAFGRSIVWSSTWFSDDVDRSSVLILSAHAGYSYRPLRGGLYLRLSLVPIISLTNTGVRALPWFGLGLGGAF